MSRASRVFFSACAALIGYVIGYALPIYARLPRAFYDPIGRQWHWARGLGPIPMGYVGQILWGVAAALGCAGLAWLATSRRSREPEERSFTLWTAWALTALAIVIGYFTWNNWP